MSIAYYLVQDFRDSTGQCIIRVHNTYSTLGLLQVINYNPITALSSSLPGTKDENGSGETQTGSAQKCPQSMDNVLPAGSITIQSELNSESSHDDGESPSAISDRERYIVNKFRNDGCSH